MDKVAPQKDIDEPIPSFSYSMSADTSPSIPPTPTISAMKQHLDYPSVPSKPSSESTENDSPPSYEWCIRGDELQSLQNAAHEEGFESGEFKLSNHPHKTVQAIPFKLEIYPVPTLWSGTDHFFPLRLHSIY